MAAWRAGAATTDRFEHLQHVGGPRRFAGQQCRAHAAGGCQWQDLDRHHRCRAWTCSIRPRGQLRHRPGDDAATLSSDDVYPLRQDQSRRRVDRHHGAGSIAGTGIPAASAWAVLARRRAARVRSRRLLENADGTLLGRHLRHRAWRASTATAGCCAVSAMTRAGRVRWLSNERACAAAGCRPATCGWAPPMGSTCCEPGGARFVHYQPRCRRCRHAARLDHHVAATRTRPACVWIGTRRWRQPLESAQLGDGWRAAGVVARDSW